MQYVMCGCLENDIDILYTKNKIKFGLITLTLDPSIKSNFFERSISNKEKATIVILNEQFLSEEYCKLLKKDVTALLKGKLIKTPTFENPNSEFSKDEIRALNSDCVLFLGKNSDISIFNFPREEELERREYKANILSFYSILTNHQSLITN